MIFMSDTIVKPHTVLSFLSIWTPTPDEGTTNHNLRSLDISKFLFRPT
jgi:hypothetical protein